MNARAPGLMLALLLAAPLCTHADPAKEAGEIPAGSRNGREIYESFRDGLADPTCKTEASARWQAHFAHAPRQLAAGNDDVLPLFGYVVDSVRAAGLPTEFALIPFVESGYKPGARSSQGPAGLWQMIAITARNHKVTMRPGYDGRLSPVDSTTAAVRYLKTLYGMFAGDWRLAVMAYNAGEYRVLNALKRGGQTARDADPESLPGLSSITQAYVRKLHALSCLLEQADDRDEWLQALDRPVPMLEAVALPDGANDIATWAHRNGQDAAQLLRLNPAYANGKLPRMAGRPVVLLAASGGAGANPTLAPAEGSVDSSESVAAEVITAPPASDPPAKALPETQAIAGSNSADATNHALGRTHTVTRGDNLSRIASRYGIRVADLLERNALTARSVLHPGMTLRIDGDDALGEPAQGAAHP